MLLILDALCKDHNFMFDFVGQADCLKSYLLCFIPLDLKRQLTLPALLSVLQSFELANDYGQEYHLSYNVTDRSIK